MKATYGKISGVFGVKPARISRIMADRKIADLDAVEYVGKERNPNLSPAITQLPPVFLDELVYAKSNQGGYDVGKGSYFLYNVHGKMYSCFGKPSKNAHPSV